MLVRYLTFLYLKFFLIILISFIIFFVGLDYIQNFKSLPSSANLQLLYIVYKSFYAADILLPISTIFALIATKIYLIRSNELVAIYSIGYDKKRVIKPFFFTSLFITAFFIFLRTTSFSYANESAKNIKKHSIITDATSDLFLKYYNYYIYFKKLYPFQKKAEDIRIFKTQDKKLKELIKAKFAYFENNSWSIKNAKVVKIDKDNILISSKDELKLLEGFRPKILDLVYEGKVNFTILDAIYAIKLLKEQDLNIQKIKAILYAQIVYPFFAPLLMVIIFYFVPITQRVFSLTLFSFSAIIFSLVIWSLLFSLVRLSFTNILSPEITTITPVTLLALFAYLFYKKF